MLELIGCVWIGGEVPGVCADTIERPVGPPWFVSIPESGRWVHRRGGRVFDFHGYRCHLPVNMRHGGYCDIVTA